MIIHSQIWQYQTLSSSSQKVCLQLGHLVGFFKLRLLTFCLFLFRTILTINSSWSFRKTFWFSPILVFFWTLYWVLNDFGRLRCLFFQNFLWTDNILYIFYFCIFITNKIFHWDKLKKLPSRQSSLHFHKKVYQHGITFSIFE